MKKYSLCIGCLLTCFNLIAEEAETTQSSQSADNEKSRFSDEEISLWESDPIKIDAVDVQILDKVSGKVYHAKLTDSITFGTIVLKLEKAFKNSPEDMDEVYALIKIIEDGQELFHNWLFASSPSINRFEHPIYDVRIEFSHDEAQ